MSVLDEKRDFTEGDINYIHFLINTSGYNLSEREAECFMRIVYTYREKGKEAALKGFEELAEYIIKKSEAKDAIFKVSYLAGSLYPNGIATKDEARELSKKYRKIIKKRK